MGEFHDIASRLAAGPIGGPAAPKQGGAPPPAPAGKHPTRHALVVGGDEPNLHLCQLVLERSGFKVERVDTGIAAVVAAREWHPDLIVVDLQLRDATSREAVAWLRSNATLAETPIYVLTSTAEDARLSPQSIPLHKPVSARTILRLIGKFARC